MSLDKKYKLNNKEFITGEIDDILVCKLQFSHNNMSKTVGIKYIHQFCISFRKMRME